jgi:DNA-binding transcriptional regulator LsrR (DeoR family)
MADTPTADQVIQAAQDLDPSGFTRAQLAEKLGVKPMDLQDPVKEARQSGRLEKSGQNDQGKGLFRLAGS